MVRLDVITTRGGDAGQTSLGDGSRVAKDSLRIEAIGAVDEANATLGLLRLQTRGDPHDAMLARIQNDLFDLGADLCVPGDSAEGRLRVADAHCARLDAEIAAMNAELPPLRSFVLPGGTPAAAHAHLARTAARRAERVVVALAAAEAVNPAAIRYLNRLSDHLFVLSRALNAGGDVLWVPGGSQG
ncbi:cob(I)yrinic acid a,c-diamide adenosyltransferase [Teichococcus vastitatis]|jgi:cob(I)alamin adenosyltransferase|uniref:Corrinoid adenosyltransferase n=1 Tax=Teichococcus vastitatis TaxID=2307076 RepID=A0ABS9WBG9_9PROT|nr:cob(I)yrinic acid a,c-diamide adenosyltransferase [Pseudoroseomonas vastitatis]MCI0756568.1 cob(I)yrinic acid a,c-diamide adenosyltransferase [Pseudoroseomonas vastitatis]